jgi:hypothetical protein
MTEPWILRIPKSRKEDRKIRELLEQVKKAAIPCRIEETDDTEPSLQMYPTPPAWNFIGFKEIQAVIERWEDFWRPIYEKEKALYKKL